MRKLGTDVGVGTKPLPLFRRRRRTRWVRIDVPVAGEAGSGSSGLVARCRRALLDILPVGLNPPVIGEGLVGVVVLPRGGADRVGAIQGSFSGERWHRQGD